ncbi:MAG: cation:dicarboxylase symporter family transporter [Eubacteriales bacterium]|nr:cation:dicarboxylase symporter family transporter [Eubacteriales bacterium]
MKKSLEIKLHSLSGSSIDEIGAELEHFFEEHGDERKNAIRMAFAAQEILLKYRTHFDDDCVIRTVQTARLGMVRFEIRIPGQQFDPFADAEEENELMQLLLSRMNIAPTWSYKKGCNRISFIRQEKKKLGSLAQMGIAIVSAAILGMICSAFAPELGLFLSETVLSPIFDSLMGIISTMAALLIFISVMNSICGLNDLSTLSRVGRTMLLSMLKWLTLCSTFTAAGMVLFYTFKTSAVAGIDLTKVFQMFIDIVPKNLLDPMLNNNTLQLLTLAVIFGISILSVSSSAGSIIKILVELETVVQRTTLILLNLLPAVIFISVFQLFTKGQLTMLVSSIRIPLIYSLIGFLWLLLLYARVCIRCGVSPLILLKKLTPVFIQGFLTASSAATLFQNMNTCEKDLGIDKKLVNFGVPMGQVVYMPGVLCELGALMFGIAYAFGIELTWMMLLIESILAILLSIALPPIPGAGVLCFSIMMNQLGIPLEGLAIALPLEVLIDHIATGLNLSMLQLELIRVGDKLGMLDKKILRSKKS